MDTNSVILIRLKKTTLTCRTSKVIRCAKDILVARVASLRQCLHDVRVIGTVIDILEDRWIDEFHCVGA